MTEIEKNWWRINSEWQVNITGMFSRKFYKFHRFEFGHEIYHEVPDCEVPIEIKMMAATLKVEF